MVEKSFAEILSKLLQGEPNPTEPPKTASNQAEVNLDSWLFQVGPVGLQEPLVKAQAKKHYSQSVKSRQSMSPPKVEVPVQSPEKRKVEPKPKTFRKEKRLTADQKTALQKFESWGHALSVDSSLEEIKSVYRSLSKKYHPDRNPQGVEIFKVLSKSYRELIKGF
ncbi:MAG: DnaJ domain-containing protein [Oligoflexia bacterium]|nr:DnaJ domain-containing protein [Oligoflexia bacterium]